MSTARPSAPEPEDVQTGIARHHFKVMKSLMHVSILRKDFDRASRAFGLLLRSNVKDEPFDLRRHGYWSVGAEIILGRHTEHRNGGDTIISEEGFQQAKDYFNQLMVLYPYKKKHRENTVSSRTFYPTMYGLYIHELQQKYQEGLKGAENTSSSYPSSSPDYAQDSTMEHAGDYEEQDSKGRTLAVKTSILDKAIALADEMTQCMLSPPCEDYFPMIQLRAMLARWIIDLSDDVFASDQDRPLDPSHKSTLAREKQIAEAFAAEVQLMEGELPETLHT